MTTYRYCPDCGLRMKARGIAAHRGGRRCLQRQALHYDFVPLPADAEPLLIYATLVPVSRRRSVWMIPSRMLIVFRAYSRTHGGHASPQEAARIAANYVYGGPGALIALAARAHR